MLKIMPQRAIFWREAKIEVRSGESRLLDGYELENDLEKLVPSENNVRFGYITRPPWLN